MGWIPWRYWNIVEFVELPEKAGKTEMSGMSGKTGMSVITGCLLEGLVAECLECPVEHTDGFLEDLLAFYA